jgi:hypothetical protein
MSIDKKEIERVKNLQIGKKCLKCKVGKYIRCLDIFCDNCGKSYPITNRFK